MEASINEKLAEIDATEGLPEYKVKQEKTKLSEWRKQWSLKSRRKSLKAARDDKGEIINDPELASQIFSSHWGKVFDEKKIEPATREFRRKY